MKGLVEKGRPDCFWRLKSALFPLQAGQEDSSKTEQGHAPSFNSAADAVGASRGEALSRILIAPI